MPLPLNLDAGNDRRYRVYVIRLSNDDFYVGSTGKSINERFLEHLDTTRKKRARPVIRHGAKAIETRYCIRKSYASRNAAVRRAKPG